MSSGWSIFIIVMVVAHIVAYSWLLYSTSRMKTEDHEQGETTGHVWDGIEEYNNPLPKWWLYLFVITIVFSVIYLILYPGLGNYEGTLKWTQEKAWASENEVVKANRSKLFSTFIDKPIAEMTKDTKAMEIGERLFANHCSTCHGSDAQGAVGFPNLADNDWLYGGEPDTIVTSIANGRIGVMPPWGAALGDDGVKQVAAYIRSFTTDNQEKNLVTQGQGKFAMFCAACHGADGTGNHALGAPNLVDNIWLHSYDSSMLEKVLIEGVSGNMPAHADILDDNSIKVLAAYVYSLTNE
ncbi:Cytochrome c oxidase (cbb3-type) subunit CcoP [hydrothermal vent metagenome]|uniref:Cytochrome c oxidase subunit III n=1 Tax=hydrothermal vent metagenome TaxID=652676 RepID=A0A3B0VLG4_9ZZZZ